MAGAALPTSARHHVRRFGCAVCGSALGSLAPAGMRQHLPTDAALTAAVLTDHRFGS